MARRSGVMRATRMPIVVPMTRARAKPVMARITVVPIADQKRSVWIIWPSCARVSAGAGKTYAGRQPLQ